MFFFSRFIQTSYSVKVNVNKDDHVKALSFNLL